MPITKLRMYKLSAIQNGMELEQIIGKKSHTISAADLAEKAKAYKHVHLDLGTGDGLFAWRLAKEKPDTFVIGFDADRASLAEASARAAKKPARGGTPNAAFICMNVLEMPDVLHNFATSISVNFPWGSLLTAMAVPEEDVLKHYAALCQKGAAFVQYINLYVFQKESERLSKALPELNEEDIQNRLIPAFKRCGFNYIEHHFIAEGEPVNVASTWGGRLTRNSKRPTLYIKCEVA